MLDPISLSSSLVKGPEFSVGQLDETAPAQTSGKAFGGMLGDAIGKLDSSIAQLSASSQSLATGQATDPTKVVMDVERASLELQMATQFRNKAVDAYQDIIRMQI